MLNLVLVSACVFTACIKLTYIIGIRPHWSVLYRVGLFCFYFSILLILVVLREPYIFGGGMPYGRHRSEYWDLLLLVVPKSWQPTSGNTAYSVLPPKLWNELPTHRPLLWSFKTTLYVLCYINRADWIEVCYFLSVLVCCCWIHLCRLYVVFL